MVAAGTHNPGGRSWSISIQRTLDSTGSLGAARVLTGDVGFRPLLPPFQMKAIVLFNRRHSHAVGAFRSNAPPCT